MSELTSHAESSDDTIDLTVESDDVADEEGPPSDDAAEVPPGQTMAPHLGQKAAPPPGIRASGRFFHGAAEISDFEMVIKIGEIEKIRREEDQAAEEADDLQQGTVAPHIPPNDVPTRVLPNPEIFRGLAHFQQTVSSIELRAVTIEKTMHLKRKLLRDFPTMDEGGEDDNRAKRIEVDASGRAPILGVDLIGRKSRSLKDINEDMRYNNMTMFEENDDVTVDEVKEDVAMTVDEVKEDVAMTVDEVKEEVAMTVDEVKEEVDTTVDDDEEEVDTTDDEEEVDTTDDDDEEEVDTTDDEEEVDTTDDDDEEEVDVTDDDDEEEVDVTDDDEEEEVDTTDDDDDDFYIAMNPTPPPEAELAEAEASSALANLRHYDTSDASDGLRLLVDALEANLKQRPPEFDELLTENDIVYASYTDEMPDGNWERALFAQRYIEKGEIIAVYIGEVCSSENDVEGDYLFKVKKSDASDQEDESDSEEDLVKDPDYVPALRQRPGDLPAVAPVARVPRTQHQKDHVTVDGDPENFPENLAAYANCAEGDAANAEFDDYIKPNDDLCDGIDDGPLPEFLPKYFRFPQTVRRFALQDNIVWPVLVARQDIPKGTEIRVDYGDEYREQMLERGIPRTALENSKYKNLTWSYPQGP